MSRITWFIVGAASGAAAGLLLAPATGDRTRSLVKDKAVKYSHDVSDFVGSKSVHVSNKIKGTVSGLTGSRPMDEELQEEVATA